MKIPRKLGESLVDWLWRCEAIRGQYQVDEDFDAVQQAIRQHDEVAAVSAAWSRLGWEHQPKAREADRIRAHGMGIALLLLLCLALPAHGQDNKALNRASLWASIGTRSADAIQTCYASRVPGWREHSAPIHSCAGAAAWSAGMVSSGWAGGRLLHRMGWHRVESVPNWISTGWAAEGVAYTSIHTHH